MQDGGLLTFFEDLFSLRTRTLYNDQDSISSETTIDQLPRRAKTEQVHFEDPDIHPTVNISPEDLTSNPVSHLIVFLRYPLK